MLFPAVILQSDEGVLRSRGKKENVGGKRAGDIPFVFCATEALPFSYFLIALRTPSHPVPAHAG